MKEKKAEQKSTRARLGEFMGYSVVAVIRAMGKAGFSFEEAKAALAKEKIHPAQNTLYIQLRAGKKGLAKPADIDPKKLDALRTSLPPSEADKGRSRAGKKGDDLDVNPTKVRAKAKAKKK